MKREAKKRTLPTLLKRFSFDDGNISFSAPKRRADQYAALLRVRQVFGPLLALAASGNKKAAEVLADSLLWAVAEFQALVSDGRGGHERVGLYYFQPAGPDVYGIESSRRVF